MDEIVKWKQMMPIPDNVIVLFEVENDNKETTYENLENEEWVNLCLVLYEVHQKDGSFYSDIGIYVVDPSGYGELETDYKLVKRDKAYEFSH
ncbi:MAG: hypothetical protein GX800_10280 [Clostridiaceae bacterium]|jgi:hypothetical protein|nr:hypothetical protein [Clostridiaceae bacterium]